LVFLIHRIDHHLLVFPILERPASPEFGVAGVEFPHIIGIEQPTRFIETSLSGSAPIQISQVPFAKYGRGITVLLQYLTERGIGSVQTCIVRCIGIEYSGAARIATGQ